MESRRLLIAILLSILVIAGWRYVMGPAAVPSGPEESHAAEGEREEGSGELQVQRPEPVGEAEEAKAPNGVEAEPEPKAGAAEVEAPAIGGPPIRGKEEERPVLETDRVRIEFSSRGAQLLSFQLKRHEARDGGAVDLVRMRQGGAYPFGLLGPAGESLPLNDVLFQTERIDEGKGVRFRYRGPEGDASKAFRFREDPRNGVHDLLEVSIDLAGREDWSVLLGPGLRNPSEKERSGNRFARRRGVFNIGGEVETEDAKKAAQPREVPASGLRWVGLDDNYFLTVLMFDPRLQGEGGAVFEPVLLIPGEDGETFEPFEDGELLSEDEKKVGRELRVRVRPGKSGLRAVAYWGAKNLERLSSLSVPGSGGQVSAHLDRTIELGIFRIIADPLLRGLHWIHQNLVANYGWAIVLMTLMLKLLLLPLTHKSYASMRKMQEIQPKMEALRAKYRPKLKDKQGRPNMEAQRKMNEEMMALFKQEGVNPAGGCLPMVLQMPFFFAFYFILREAVELRNAAWLWVPDLSAPEPMAIHILPLVMTVTQFFQQRMTPMAGDPMQRRLFQLLPFVFLVLFWGMPSGLVLYWLTNNVLTIGQQSIYNHLKKRGASPATAAGDSGKLRGAKASRGQAK